MPIPFLAHGAPPRPSRSRSSTTSTASPSVRYYRFQYPAPGAASLAARVGDRLAARGIAHVDRRERGLDHGVYCPLAGMFPRADVPVLQASLPGLDPAALVAFGRAIAPLANEDVDALGVDFRTRAPTGRGEVTFPITGFWNGMSFTKRSVQFA